MLIIFVINLFQTINKFLVKVYFADKFSAVV